MHIILSGEGKIQLLYKTGGMTDMKEIFTKKILMILASTMLLTAAFGGLTVCAEENDDIFIDFIEPEYFDAVEEPHEETGIEEDGIAGENNDEEDGLDSADYAISDWTYGQISGGIEITGYTGSETAVEIPSTIDGYKVLSIGENALKGKDIKSVVIPQGIKEIDDKAFYNCTSLDTITLPSSLEIMGDNAFSYTAISSVTIPSKVTKCGHTTSKNCSVFYGCSDLEEVTFASGIQTIPSTVLWGVSSVKRITLPPTVTCIGDRAFSETGIQTISLPDRLKEIQKYAFNNCTSLDTITLPSSLEIMGDNAFSYTAISSVTIPSKVTKCGQTTSKNCSVFYGCSDLEEVRFASGMQTIPSKVLWGNTYVTKVYIPVTVNEIGDRAFTGCDRLVSVIFSGTEEAWNRISGRDQLSNATITFLNQGAFNDISYSFENFREAANEDLCYFMFGNNELARIIYETQMGDGGNCYGMSLTAALFYVLNDVNVKEFNNSSYINELKESFVNNNWTYRRNGNITSMSVKDFIQGMMIAQNSSSINNIETFVDNPYDLYKIVDSEMKKGRPVGVGIYGSGAHEILAYGVEDVSANLKRIIVYDSNWPGERRSIILSNETGNESDWCWTYTLWDGETWGTGRPNCKLDYITYDGYYALWCNKGNLADPNITSFTTNIDNLNIYSENNDLLASLTDGQLNTINKNIRVSGLKGATPGAGSNNKVLVVSLPVGSYTIERTDSADNNEWITSYANVELGGRIKSKAKKVSIAADDKKGITQVQFDEGTKDDFEIELRSSKKNESDVTIKGTSAEAGGIVKMENGQCQTENVRITDMVSDKNSIDKASISSTVYNGTEQAPTVTYNGKTLAVNTDYTWEKADKSKVYKNAGTYEVILTGKGNYTGTSRKSFAITAKAITPTITLAKKEYTYNGKAKKPSVTVKDGNIKLASSDYSVSYASGRKNVGAYKVTVTLKGNYSGKKAATFKIVPKGTTLNKPKAEKKAIKVSWKKQTKKMSKSRITGYQIQVATDKKFTKNKKTVTVKGYKTTSKKVTKLKGGKKYYVRIRTYSTLKGKKYYSPWSGTKNVKTKK